MNPFVLARCRGMLCIIAVCIFVCFSVPMLAQESIVEPGAEVEVLADGFSFTEGPAADSKGNVYFTDQPNDRIVIWMERGWQSLDFQTTSWPFQRIEFRNRRESMGLR
jgi:sugar lactone lactonase YvrE